MIHTRLQELTEEEKETEKRKAELARGIAFLFRYEITDGACACIGPSCGQYGCTFLWDMLIRGHQQEIREAMRSVAKSINEKESKKQGGYYHAT